MIDLQCLIEIDGSITLAINGSDSLFLDGVAGIFTSVVIWLPLALVLLYMIVRNNNTKRMIWLIVMIALTIVCCDQISSSLFKPLVARFRPTQDPVMLHLVDKVNGYTGGQYGFVSSHAANSFGIAVFVIWLVRDRFFTFSVLLWAVLNSLIRTYLGVHFFGDILCGAILGAVIGSAIYWLYVLFSGSRNLIIHKHTSENLFTQSGYLLNDVALFSSTLFSTFVLIILIALVRQGILPQ